MRVKVGRALLYSGGAVLGYTLYQSGGDVSNIGAVRFGRAAVAVGKIAVDYKRTLGVEYLSDQNYEEAKSECHLRAANHLLKLCCDNGGVFVKVGQHMGALDYLLPEEYVNTMKVLHNRSPQMPLDDIYSVLREELGKDPKEVFASFDEEPLGTASLAQVHKAVLHTGETVAVKVQHKFVKKHSFVDIWSCDLLVRGVKVAFPQFSFMWLANEMKINLPQELDFTQEGRNSEKVSRIFRDFYWLKIPGIYWSLSSSRVLVMEYCEGAQINDVENLRKQGVDVYDVSKKIGQMYSKMIFDDGYVHCDPHPGNVLVNKKSSGETEIVLLDHGLYTQLNNKFRYDYADFWLAIINRDVEAIKTSADKLGVGSLYHLFACMVTARSWTSIQKGLDVAPKTSSESAEIKASVIKYFKEIADILAGVNRQMILIFKTNDLLRGIESSLGTKNSMATFIQMSRACFKVIQEKRILSTTSSISRVYINIWGRWVQLKISCYEIFLYLYWSRFGQVLRLR